MDLEAQALVATEVQAALPGGLLVRVHQTGGGAA